MNILLDSISKSRNQFAKIHAGDYYGGSEVASISGVGYESPLSVWLRKTGKTAHFEGNHQTEYGSYMEPFLKDLLKKKFGITANLLDQVWQHEEHPWWIGSPDAICPGMDGEGPSLVEFKTHKIYAAKHWEDGSASDSAMCQLQWYLGMNYYYSDGYCVALIGGDTDKFYAPRFERNPDVIKQLFETVSKFRELVQADIPPNAGHGDAKAIKDALEILPDKDKTLDLSDNEEANRLVARYAELEAEQAGMKESWDSLEKEMKSIKNTFLLMSKNCGFVRVNNTVIKLQEIQKSGGYVKPSSYYKVTIRGV